jgi:hypothetical protein
MKITRKKLRKLILELVLNASTKKQIPYPKNKKDYLDIWFELEFKNKLPDSALAAYFFKTSWFAQWGGDVQNAPEDMKQYYIRLVKAFEKQGFQEVRKIKFRDSSPEIPTKGLSNRPEIGELEKIISKFKNNVEGFKNLWWDAEFGIYSFSKGKKIKDKYLADELIAAYDHNYTLGARMAGGDYITPEIASSYNEILKNIRNMKGVNIEKTNYKYRTFDQNRLIKKSKKKPGT